MTFTDQDNRMNWTFPSLKSLDWRRSSSLHQKSRTKDCKHRIHPLESTTSLIPENAHFCRCFRLNFVDDQEIQLHHLGINSTGNAWDPISEEVVLEALELILDKRNYPLMVMCNLGRHRTGNHSPIYLPELPDHTHAIHRYSDWMLEETSELESDVHLWRVSTLCRSKDPNSERAVYWIVWYWFGQDSTQSSIMAVTMNGPISHGMNTNYPLTLQI